MQTADDPGADRMRRRADVDGAAVGCKPLIRSIACPVLCPRFTPGRFFAMVIHYMTSYNVL